MMGSWQYPQWQSYPQMTVNKTLNKQKSNANIVKKPGHLIRDCRKWMRKEQEQRNDPSIQNAEPSTSKSFAPCPHCQRTNHPPENSWSGHNAANRPKRFKQDHPADNRNDGQEQGNLTHAGPSSILKNPLNWKSHDSNGQITHQVDNMLHLIHPP